MKSKKSRTLLSVFVVLLILVLSALGVLFYINNENNKTNPYFLANTTQYVEVFDSENNTLSLPRGTLVNIKNKKEIINDVEYNQFVIDEKTYYVLDEYIKEDRNNCVLEKTVYALRDHVLTKNHDDFYIAGWVYKKDELKVNDYHELLEDGSVDYYFVNDTGYISGKYVATTYYETALDSSIYSDVYYGDGGDPRKIDYYPKEELSFNHMPEIVKALYINAEAVVDTKEYIDIAKKTKGINAFVVDIKDCYVDTQLAYDSPVGKKYAPSTSNIPNTFEVYKENMKKIKDAGYYLIGRITAFKDDAFAIDNPEEALTYNGQLYTYGGVKWPSIFSRKMWEYDLALASEAIMEMGFDEIQFDYIRLPEDVEDVELHNVYNETRAQAVVNFLRYASEYLHNMNVYVSGDVFGETSGDEDDKFSSYVTYYGQFWPAISNALDAISAMPYPDHFPDYAFGISLPWLNPYDLFVSWGKATKFAQDNTYDPGKCRTWIMAQNSDPYDVVYGPKFVKDQIDGLTYAGINDGYMTWNSASDLYKYEQYIEVFD